MKIVLSLTIFISLSLAGAVSAEPVASDPASPLLGSWALDISQMSVPADARPKAVTITFAVTGEGKWTTRVLIVGKDASERDMMSSYQRNGSAVPIEGDQLEADTVAVATPTPKIMVMAMAKDRHPASTRVYTVSDDGNIMVEEAVTYNDSGMPVIRTNRFSRIH